MNHTTAELETYKQHLREIQKNYYDKQPPEILYHYTKLSVLKSILENRRFWFTDYRYLNDPSELIFSNHIIQETIKKVVTRLSLNQDFWECFLKKYPEMLNQNISVYTFSFSTKKDYLPAWRWYGDDGAGCSIGFSSSISQYEEHGSKEDESNVVLTNIYYEQEEFCKIIARFIEDTHRSFPDLINPGSPGYSGAMDELAGQCISLAPIFKSEAYKEEHEYRLYQMEKKGGRYVIPRKFYAGEKTPPAAPCILMDPLIGYGKIPRAESSLFKYEDILEIVVGPRLDFSCAERGIRQMLVQYGYDVKKVKILQSQTPYRG